MKTSRCNLSILLRVKIDSKCQKLIRSTVHLGTTVLLNLEIIAFFVVKWILCCYPEAAIKDFIVASRKHKLILLMFPFIQNVLSANQIFDSIKLSVLIDIDF